MHLFPCSALFVNGDIRITFAGGAVDWFGVCALLIVLSLRKRLASR